MASKRSRTPTRAPRPTGNRTAQTKYEYVELSKASLSSSDPCNFYGVVIDASFPYKREKFFVCSLKVIDPTLNPKISTQNYATVVLYAQRFEDLPIIHRIGDIIRVHRAKLRIYNGKRQFNVNMYYQGSWVLYSSEKVSPLGQVVADAPYAYSGKKSTQESQDVAIVKTLKKWTNTFFTQNAVIQESAVTPLKKVESTQSDFDIVAKVLQVFQLDDYTNELKLKDTSGAVFYTLALKIKFPHLKEGAVVKIRSCTYDETTLNKKVLVLEHYSNIMTFIGSSKLAGNVASKVSDDKADEKASLKAKDGLTPVLLTEVDKKHQSLPLTNLHDLFHQPDNSVTTFRTCFYVTKVEPGNVQDCVKVYNKGSKKTTSAKGAKGGDLIYQVQFLCKDVSTQSSNNVYRVLLYTHEGLGSNFFSTKATNLWSDSKACAKVKDSVELLTRYNSWVDCVVERRHGYYFIKDTKMIF